MKFNITKNLPTRVLHILVGVIALVFLMFWLIGYNRPYDEDPNFTAPLFTDLLLVVMLLVLVFAIATAVWSVVRSFKTLGRGDKYRNNIPVRKIGAVVAAGTFVVMLLTFLIGPTSPMTINGAAYNDALGLRLSNMFISTSLLMIAAAVVAVIYFSTKNIRR